jgi:uncharacterized protein YecT (DUF1311 family)
MRFAFAFCIALCAASPALAALQVKPVHIAIKQKGLEINVAYPQTGNAAVDRETANWAKKTIADFKDEAAQYGSDGGTGQPYTLDVTYTVPRNDNQMFEALFTDSEFFGGAHPGHEFEAMNFLMPDGWRVYLPEIFSWDGLKKISQLGIADLDKQLLAGGLTDKDWIARGAAPQWDNFAVFNLLPGTLDIQYNEYTVAAYAAGPQETKFPLSALKGFYRTNWRAPAASFDCAKATASIEKTICSDVALARLDRDVATAYHTHDVAADSGNTTTNDQQAGQRTWLTQRGKTCPQTGAAAVKCLTTLYGARLTALNKAQPQ